MRWVTATVAAFALSGCVHEVDIGRGCRDNTVEGLYGQKFDHRMRDMIRNRTHAFKVRVVRPGEAVTMDFQHNRVTVTLDERERIAAVHCG